MLGICNVWNLPSVPQLTPKRACRWLQLNRDGAVVWAALGYRCEGGLQLRNFSPFQGHAFTICEERVTRVRSSEQGVLQRCGCAWTELERAGGDDLPQGSLLRAY